MKFTKKNKYTIMAMLVFLLLVFLGYKTIGYLAPSSAKAVYGDRLDGISSFTITDDQFKNVVNGLTKNERVTNVTYNLQGKLIYFVIVVTNDTSLADAKVIANTIITDSYFSDAEKNYYSFQVIVKKEDKSLNNFPIIGYKHTQSKEFVFTKDREVTANEEN